MRWKTLSRWRIGRVWSAIRSSKAAYRWGPKSEIAERTDAAWADLGALVGPGNVTCLFASGVELPTGWEDWSAGESANGEIIFQAKPAIGGGWLRRTDRD